MLLSLVLDLYGNHDRLIILSRIKAVCLFYYSYLNIGIDTFRCWLVWQQTTGNSQPDAPYRPPAQCFHEWMNAIECIQFSKMPTEITIYKGSAGVTHPTTSTNRMVNFSLLALSWSPYSNWQQNIKIHLYKYSSCIYFHHSFPSAFFSLFLSPSHSFYYIHSFFLFFFYCYFLFLSSWRK